MGCASDKSTRVSNFFSISIFLKTLTAALTSVSLNFCGRASFERALVKVSKKTFLEEKSNSSENSSKPFALAGKLKILIKRKAKIFESNVLRLIIIKTLLNE